jgi:hypothetical protein
MPVVINELEVINDNSSNQEESVPTTPENTLSNLLQSQQIEQQWQMIEERKERLNYD